MNNIMMEGTQYAERWHPWGPSMRLDFTGLVQVRYSRTNALPSIILSTLASRRYSGDSVPLETTRDGTDLTDPEFANLPHSYDPCSVDIYCLGNFLKEWFVEVL